MRKMLLVLSLAALLLALTGFVPPPPDGGEDDGCPPMYVAWNCRCLPQTWLAVPGCPLVRCALPWWCR